MTSRLSATRIAGAGLRWAWRQRAIWLPAVGGVLVGAAGLLAWTGSGYVYTGLHAAVADVPIPAVAEGRGSTPAVLGRRRTELWAALAAVTPRGRYIVIDRTLNRLYLRDANRQILEALCSAGSGAVLHEPEGQRRWLFATPRGRFEVLAKAPNPVWTKPDWAFIEEGLPVPVKQRERVVYGALGEYALYFGDGYMIHGTLYERLLGRSVSHGCVRLGRDDLHALYAATPLGTPIYVY